MMAYTYNITVGDVSGDGHNRREVFTIKSNKDKHAIEAALNKGADLIGYDLRKLFDEYEQNSIDVEVLRAIDRAIEAVNRNVVHSARIEDRVGEDQDEWSFVETCAFVWLIILQAQIGDPHIVIVIEDPETLKCMDGYGYGLFID